jgi:hypothetical protein
MKQAPRNVDPGKVKKYVEEYTAVELLELALKMLDGAAERQRGKNAFLHNNLTLEVIRAKVEQSEV